tara:strand:+ start:2209 stop:2571 length:363 start_codon:yes stop_codon:yes gene_type:complete
MTITGISALTLSTRDMARAVAFYRALGFDLLYGDETASFVSFAAGGGFLNLTAEHRGSGPAWWGRAIFHVDDVDALYALALAAGMQPEAPPRDAEWGERYFHLVDPDGHELSFAKPLTRM